MKSDIILAGVGGQGIISIANVIGISALKDGLYLKQAEVHGMSQRGGDVQSNLRLSSQPIHSDLIPLRKADIIVSLEPMECLRYLPYLAKTGWIVTNTTPFVNINNYPDIKDIMDELERIDNLVAFDMDDVAKKIGSPKSANMVLLGAISPFLEISPESLEDAISEIFIRKGDAIVQKNQDAFKVGRDTTINFLKEKEKWFL